MENEDQLPEHEFEAKGPQGLEQVLDVILARSEADGGFNTKKHAILYTLGQQKALISVDTSEKPFHFYFEDLLGRPATQAVKDTIADFLWEKCGEKEKYNQEDVQGGA